MHSGTKGATTMNEHRNMRRAPVPTSTGPQRRENEIERRLENWGTWASEGQRGGSACMTGVIYDRGRRAAGAHAIEAQQRTMINRGDAGKIASAFARLAANHRELLHWTYVEGLKAAVVAKACNFPKDEYASRLTAAQTAIESAIDEDARRMHERQRF